MKEVILAVLKKAANRTQVLGDNRMHDLIVDDDFEAVADEIRDAVWARLTYPDRETVELPSKKKPHLTKSNLAEELAKIEGLQVSELPYKIIVGTPDETYDYFPKSDRLLLRSINRWLDSGLYWLNARFGDGRQSVISEYVGKYEITLNYQ